MILTNFYYPVSIKKINKTLLQYFSAECLIWLTLLVDYSSRHSRSQLDLGWAFTPSFSLVKSYDFLLGCLRRKSKKKTKTNLNTFYSEWWSDKNYQHFFFVSLFPYCAWGFSFLFFFIDRENGYSTIFKFYRVIFFFSCQSLFFSRLKKESWIYICSAECD